MTVREDPTVKDAGHDNVILNATAYYLIAGDSNGVRANVISQALTDPVVPAFSGPSSVGTVDGRALQCDAIAMVGATGPGGTADHAAIISAAEFLRQTDVVPTLPIAQGNNIATGAWDWTCPDSEAA